MTMLTAALLRAVMPAAGARAEVFAEALEYARSRYIGEDPDDVAHWLAQVAHESGQLRYTRELADGSAYEGRTGLGNVQPGDGRRFRGRGLIQLTGRDNYTRYGVDAHVDSLGQPELLEQLPYSADVAGWFWKVNNISSRTAGAVDRVLAVTKIVNGGTNGLADRRKFYAAAKEALSGVQAPAPIEHHDWPAEPTPEPVQEKSMEPISIALALMPIISKAIPEVAKWFKGDVPVSERNINLATKILDTVTEATGSVNAMEAAQKIATDPAALAQAREAVIPMLELVEAGGGGIASARKFDTDGQASKWQWNQSAAFLATLLMLPLVYMAAAAVLFQVGGDWPTEVRASALMMVLGIAISIGAFYWGSSNKPSVAGK